MPKVTKEAKSKNKEVTKISDITKSTSKVKSTLANRNTENEATSKKTNTKGVARKSTAKVKTNAKGATSKSTAKAKASSKKVSSKDVKETKDAKTVKARATRLPRKVKTAFPENFSPMEYYDLPIKYSKTTVKLLAQTPNTLFVYWDISDIDRTNFTEKYGNDFFNKTRPVLLVHNKTNNYYFEVPINDFANSWYLRMQEPDCEYDIELGRRDIKNPSQYVYVSSSNELASPNDHVLFDETDFTNIRFKNVKTGSISQKDFGSIRLTTGIGNIYNKTHKVYRFYNDLYKDEVLESNKMFSNPSSNSAFKTF